MSAGFRLELECGHTIKRTRKHQHFKCPECGIQKAVKKIYKHGVEIPHAVPKLMYKRMADAAEWREQRLNGFVDPALKAQLAAENQALAAFTHSVDERRDLPTIGRP
jgi:transcription elongation factor Elf1